MVRIVMGNLHQGCNIFQPYNGVQCTAISLIALLTFLNCSYYSNFELNSTDIDQILFRGTHLYEEIVQSTNLVGYLGHNHLPNIISNQNNYDTEVNYMLDMYYGVVNGTVRSTLGESGFYESLSQAVLLSNFHLLTLNDLTVSLYIDLNLGHFYMFDSHERGRNALFSENGASVLVQFESFDDIASFIFDNYREHQYELTPVVFSHKSEQLSTNNHTYFSKKPKVSKVKRPYKRRIKPSLQNISDLDIGKQIHLCTDQNCNEGNTDTCMLDVGLICEVATSVNLTFIDYEKDHNHESEYERFIRQCPTEMCVCCQRFLYPDQVLFLHKPLDNSLGFLSFSENSSFCSTCRGKLLQNKVPNICMNENFLNPGPVPVELSDLSSLEKKLIQKISIFMTIVLLPGGQYAEKGLVLNLPNDVQKTVFQLPSNPDSCPHLIVKFDRESNVPQECQTRRVSTHKVKESLAWLKQNNHLYSDIDIDPQYSYNHEFINGSVEDQLEENVMIPVNSSGMCSLNVENGSNVLKISENKNDPVNVLNLTSGEEMAFPWLFPYGKYGYKYERPYKVTPNMYFKVRLYAKNSLFRKNITYLLHTAVSYDMSLLKQQVNIHMKIHKCSNGNNIPITAGNIKNINHHSDLLENSYMFMKNIKGTVAYFRNMLYDLLATFRSLGPPTFFITLSADDLHWPELGMNLENVEFKDAFGRSFFSSMRADPLITATHFERRFKALMKYVILGEKKPLGNVVDYFGRIEFQNRGSPHIHMFCWVSDLPYEINEHTASQFIALINQTICSNIPDESIDPELYELVKRLQTHHHSNYCSKRGLSSCRFGFPKAKCQKTKIITHINLSSRNKGKFYVTRRGNNSSHINDYNPTILRHWRANMDIQLIQNAEGAAFYVCSYLCKSEPDDLKNALGELIHSVFKSNPQIPKHVRLLKIGLCVLKHRRMSSQEAAYRMGNLHMLHSTRKVVYLNTRNPNKRFKILKPSKDIESLADESTDVFCTNILDYYHDRPISLESCSFYRFASWYTKCPSPTKKDRNEKIYCPTHDVWFRKNKKFNVVRFPIFSFGSDDYFYSMLLLLFPHRQEEELLNGFDNVRDAFYAKEKLFDKNFNHLFFSLTSEIENAIRRIRMCENELQASSCQSENSQAYDIDKHTHDTNLISSVDKMSVDKNHFFNFSDSDILHMHSLECSLMSVEEFRQNLKSMSSCQLKVIEFVQSFFQKSSNSDALHLFITGGAGVGKSFVTKMLIAYMQLFTASVVGSSPVVVCAPTGTAARNIHGMTIHSLLKIPVSNYIQYEQISAQMLSKLQRDFKSVHTIIIDEVSMISDKMLTYISRRLSEIKNNRNAFGNMNVIVVGDFFQLRPINGKFAFQNTLLWQLFIPIFLHENMRQSGDVHYAELLNRARIGLLNDDDISDLVGRLTFCSDEIMHYLHIFPLRENVHSFNSFMQSHLEAPLYTIEAIHFFASQDVSAGGEVLTRYIPSDNKDAGGLEKTLILTVGSRVMLIRNIYTKEGLVNGAIGVVHSFSFCNDGSIDSVNVIFDDHDIGKILQLSHMSNAVPIQKIEHTFMYGGRHITRSQFPLTLAWACTIHKVQGLSFDKIVVDLGTSVFEKGMGYVALSRVKTLSGLYLLKLDPKKIEPPNGVLEEYDRLRNVKL